ncbi:MAG TPA: DUF5655 domain-containing protein [Acidimicrobiales bacterium]|nr:DUF5655 domain-containing protein [Acidimicrobiales bacterium]
MTLEEYFSTGPEREKPIFEAVRAHLETLGPVYIEPVSVGIFFKRASTFVELRPMVKWEALSFGLRRTVDHPRIARKMKGGTRTYHVVNIREPAEVDDQVKEWLTESYMDFAP